MVKRFSKEVHLSECDDGMYVLWEDYRKLEDKITNLHSMIKALTELCTGNNVKG